MVPTVVLVLSAWWAGVWLFDHFLRRNPRYETWLQRRGVQVSAGYVGWRSNQVHASMMGTGIAANPATRRRWQLWFDIGAIYGLCAMVLAVLLLIANAIISISPWLPALSPTVLPSTPLSVSSNMSVGTHVPPPSPTYSGPQPLLTPLLPGVNIPASHLLYFFVALAVNGLVHELGHAIAAVCDGVKVNGFGVFLFVIYPGAYVELDTADLMKALPHQQMRIFTAGIYHNLIVCLFSLLLLLGGLPVALSGFYNRDLGAVVVHVPESSPLAGHVVPGSRIVGLNNGLCAIQSTQDWADCLTDLLSAQIPHPLPQQTSNPLADNLPVGNPSGRRVSDRRTETTTGTLSEKPISGQMPVANGANSGGAAALPGVGGGLSGFCTTAKKLQRVEKTRPAATKKIGQSTNQTWWLDEEGNVECCSPELKMTSPSHLCFAYATAQHSSQGSEYVCLPARQTADGIRCELNTECTTFDPDDTSANLCLYPMLPAGTVLVKVAVEDGPQPFVLFTGDPRVLFHSVMVSDYIPRWPFLPLGLPSGLETCLRYLVSLSMALSLLNIVPAYRFDGQYVLAGLLARHTDERSRQSRLRLQALILGAGSALMAANIVLSFATLAI